MDEEEAPTPGSSLAEQEYWEKRRERYLLERKRGVHRRLELAIWIVIALSIYGLRLLTSWGSHLFSLEEVVLRNLPTLMATALLILFPLVFQLVFQAFPLEFIREKRDPEKVARDEFEAAQSASVALGEQPVSAPNIVSQLKILADASCKIAEKIYTRAGVYLLFGVLIAFSGLGFFYLQSQPAMKASGEYDSMKRVDSESTVAPKTLVETFTNMAPNIVGRIGVLFFIELVAFFFLRQYRAAMDEYRYFEAIKRRREENVALVTMFLQGNGDKIDFFPFVEKCSLYSDLPKLTSGETTEILETRKLTKDEMALFEKMIDVVTKAKN